MGGFFSPLWSLYEYCSDINITAISTGVGFGTQLCKNINQSASKGPKSQRNIFEIYLCESLQYKGVIPNFQVILKLC